MSNDTRYVRISNVEPRCTCCQALLARIVTPPWRIECRRCKAVNEDTMVGPLPAPLPLAISNVVSSPPNESRDQKDCVE
jgi:phage FluMu protein Com